jgi:hypothetical protein
MTSRLPILDRAPEQKTRKEKSKGASGGGIENGRRRAVWRCRRSRGAIARDRVRKHGEEDCRRHDVKRMRRSGDGLLLDRRLELISVGLEQRCDLKKRGLGLGLLVLV